MSRKALAILLAVVIVVAIGVGVTLYILSFRTVTFDIAPENVSVTIFNQDGENEIATLEQGSSLRLQDDTYTAVPSHADYSDSPIEFVVDGEDMTVAIDPAFSNARLQSMVDSESDAINQILRRTYPNIIGDFTIQPGTLYEKGQWYATTLRQNPLPGGQQGDTYRVILHKEDDEWQIAAGPAISLGAPNYPDVPFAILTDINSR